MISAPETKISDIMDENVIYAHTEDDREDVARKISNYGFLALPVVDNERRLVGIVTVDDAMDVIQEENTEDIAKMAAMTPTDTPYLKTSVWGIWKNRIPWPACFNGQRHVHGAHFKHVRSAAFGNFPRPVRVRSHDDGYGRATQARRLPLPSSVLSR